MTYEYFRILSVCERNPLQAGSVDRSRTPSPPPPVFVVISGGAARWHGRRPIARIIIYAIRIRIVYYTLYIHIYRAYYYNRPTAAKNRSKLYSHTLYATIVCPPLIMIARAQCLPSSPSPKATGVRPPPTARSSISFFPRPDPPSSQPMLPPCFAVHAHVAVAAIRSGCTHGISRQALTAPVYRDHGIVSWRVTPRSRELVGVGGAGTDPAPRYNSNVYERFFF